MRNRYSVVSCCVLLSLVVVLDDAYAKKPQKSAEVSAIYLDVLRVKACAVGQGCSTVGGPKQINLLEMAEGKTDFAKQVLMPAKTNELRLILGKNSTIAVDGQTYPLTVPSGQVSGLKLKGQKVFGKTGGFLADITLDFDLAKGVIVKAKKDKGKGKKDKDTVVYSYSLKPVVKVLSADIEPLTDGEAAVVVMPDKESTITIGDKFSLFIPAGAVSAPMVIYAKEIEYTVEALDAETGEVVKKTSLSSNYELQPDGAEFAEPLKITIPYNPDTLPFEVSENDLAVYLNGEKIQTDIDTISKIATADVWHFTSASVSYPAGNFVFPVVGLPGYTECPSDTEDPGREEARQPGLDRSWYSVVWGGMYGKTTDKWDVRCEGSGGHSGVDIRVPGGTPVKAIASGIVEYSDYHPAWGNLIVIKHEVEGISEPVWSVYAHLSSRYVKKYDPITIANQKIGISGNTGSGSKGDHLHFQIDKGSSFSEPYWLTATEKPNLDILQANTYNPLKFIEDRVSVQPTCPSGTGLYCGKSSLGQNVNKLYYCQNGNYSVQEQCANGCQMMPAGTDDQCKEAPASCPGGNGLYCGDSSLGQNTNYLYYCQNGSYSLQEQCANGCETMPSGTSDQCKDDVQPTTCPNGNGLYCGKSSLGQNTNTLYDCQDGDYDVHEQCSNGCQEMPAGTNDKCMDVSASITVTNPTSSDEWRSDAEQHIEWTSENLSSQKDVKIEYSLDGGKTWDLVDDKAVNDGSKYWAMCGSHTVDTDHAYIRVTSLNYPSVYDISDEFTINHAAGCE